MYGKPIGSGKLRRRIIDLSLGCIEKFGLDCFSFHLNFNLVYSVSKFPTPNSIGVNHMLKTGVNRLGVGNLDAEL